MAHFRWRPSLPAGSAYERDAQCESFFRRSIAAYVRHRIKRAQEVAWAGFEIDSNFYERRSDTGLPSEVDDSEFSPDDQLIGNSDIFGVKLRNAADGSLIQKIANTEIVSIASSPDGTLIAGASPTERAPKIWRVADGTLVRALPVTTDFQFPGVAFTPNGLFIVAVYGSSNPASAIQFWRTENGRTVAIFAKPNHVHDIAFSLEPGVFAYTQFSGGVTVSFARFIR